jgi:hypothetical protein
MQQSDDHTDFVTVPCTDPTDPFNAEGLRLDQNYLQQLVAKKLLTTVPVRRPNKQDFVRVHPDPDHRLLAILVELREEREIYLVLPALALEIEESLRSLYTLHLAINRQQVIFLWPVKLPRPDGRQSEWHLSGIAAAEKAMKNWIRVAANMQLGAYEVFLADNQSAVPEWPEMSFYDLLRIAFKNRVVDKPDHPLIRKLRGEI